jgi:hypothetical protein
LANFASEISKESSFYFLISLLSYRANFASELLERATTTSPTTSTIQPPDKMANNSTNQRQAFTRQELDGMTASQYLLAAGALPPTVATYLQGGAQGLRGQYQSLFDAPVKRELREATNRDSNSLGIKKLEMNIISMLLYVAGVPAEKSCRHRVKDKETDHCQTFWAGCIVAPEGEMKKETRKFFFSSNRKDFSRVFIFSKGVSEICSFRISSKSFIFYFIFCAFLYHNPKANSIQSNRWSMCQLLLQWQPHTLSFLQGGECRCRSGGRWSRSRNARKRTSTIAKSRTPKFTTMIVSLSYLGKGSPHILGRYMDGNGGRNEA